MIIAIMRPSHKDSDIMGYVMNYPRFMKLKVLEIMQIVSVVCSHCYADGHKLERHFEILMYLINIARSSHKDSEIIV